MTTIRSNKDKNNPGMRVLNGQRTDRTSPSKKPNKIGIKEIDKGIKLIKGDQQDESESKSNSFDMEDAPSPSGINKTYEKKKRKKSRRKKIKQQNEGDNYERISNN